MAEGGLDETTGGSNSVPRLGSESKCTRPGKKCCQYQTSERL
jgi:hypothetical protein